MKNFLILFFSIVLIAIIFFFFKKKKRFVDHHSKALPTILMAWVFLLSLAFLDSSFLLKPAFLIGWNSLLWPLVIFSTITAILHLLDFSINSEGKKRSKREDWISLLLFVFLFTALFGTLFARFGEVTKEGKIRFRFSENTSEEQKTKAKDPRKYFISEKFHYSVHTADENWMATDKIKWQFPSAEFGMVYTERGGFFIMPVYFMHLDPDLDIFIDAMLKNVEMSANSPELLNWQRHEQNGYEGFVADFEKQAQKAELLYRLRLLKGKNFGYFIAAWMENDSKDKEAKPSPTLESAKEEKSKTTSTPAATSEALDAVLNAVEIEENPQILPDPDFFSEEERFRHTQFFRRAAETLRARGREDEAQAYEALASKLEAVQRKMIKPAKSYSDEKGKNPLSPKDTQDLPVSSSQSEDAMPSAMHSEVIEDNPNQLPLELIQLPTGFEIEIFASKVPDARQMAFGSGRTLFVGSREAGNVYALPDVNRDYRADEVIVIAEGLNMPSGLAFHEGALYVATVNQILRFDAIESRLHEENTPVVIFDKLPSDQHHGWKFIAFGPDGWLYVPVGAPCNICEKDDKRYASVLRIKPDGSESEIFASGIRNTVGFDWRSGTEEFWFTDNGRDLLGDDWPPDELNRATRRGLHFGFPYCHGRDFPDPEFGKGKNCGQFESPVQELTPHAAALGMTFYNSSQFPQEYQQQIFIAEHGSWNRSKKIGYRISLVRHHDGRPTAYKIFASGWLQGEEVWGRPVDVFILPDGSMLVSDDYAGTIYRISYTS